MSIYYNPNEAALYRKKERVIIKYYKFSSRSAMYRNIVDKAFNQIIEKEMKKHPNLSKVNLSRMILQGAIEIDA